MLAGGIREWRRLVMERDGGRCVWCQSDESPLAHHIKSVRDFPDRVYDVGNGVVLCHVCHIAVHNVENPSPCFLSRRCRTRWVNGQVYRTWGIRSCKRNNKDSAIMLQTRHRLLEELTSRCVPSDYPFSCILYNRLSHILAVNPLKER